MIRISPSGEIFLWAWSKKTFFHVTQRATARAPTSDAYRCCSGRRCPHSENVSKQVSPSVGALIWKRERNGKTLGLSVRAPSSRKRGKTENTLLSQRRCPHPGFGRKMENAWILSQGALILEISRRRCFPNPPWDPPEKGGGAGLQGAQGDTGPKRPLKQGGKRGAFKGGRICSYSYIYRDMVLEMID